MEETNSTEKAIYSIVCVCLVLVGGVMSGLTLGLMSLDTVDLEVSYFTELQRATWLTHSKVLSSSTGFGCGVRASI